MSRTSFGVAAPASGQRPPAAKPPVPSRMPMEIGKAIKVKRLTPEEEKKLLEIGWERGQPIPENLADLMEAVKDIQTEATDVANMPPPVSLDTPPLDYDATKEISIEDLPPTQQEHYRKMMQKIFKDAQAQEAEERKINETMPEGAGDGVAASIRKALLPGSDIEIEDDTEDLDASKPVVPITTTPTGRTHCARCKFPFDTEDPIIITDADRDTFIQSADSLQLFTKQFEFYGGSIKITIREQTRREQDLFYEQIMLDVNEKRVNNDEQLQAQRRRYQVAFQIIRINARKTDMNRPATLEAWAEKLKATEFAPPEITPADTLIRKIWVESNKEEIPDSVYRLMLAVLSEFEIIQRKLEDQSREPDFWKPRTEGS